MLKANGIEITLEGSDWAVEFDDWIYEAEDRADAFRLRSLAGGEVITRDVYVTDWRPADGQAEGLTDRESDPQGAEVGSGGSEAEASPGEDSPQGDR